MARVPLHFEPAAAGSAADFIARGHGYNLQLGADRSTVALDAGDRRALMTIRLDGADPGAAATTLAPQTGVSNYFLGNDPTAWRTGVPHFGRVAFDAVYPGIDLVYYGNDEGRLEHDFVVAPGADPQQIRMLVDGADRARLDRDGNLRLTAGGGELVLERPIAYQERESQREPVEAAYRLGDDHEVRIALGEYDASRELVIDPVLSYSSYLGGSGGDAAADIARDAAGNIYVCGKTASMDFPTSAGAFQSAPGGSATADAFVLKFSPTWSLLYSTYFGGFDDDDPSALAVDASGNVFLAGTTTSTNLPVTAGVLQPAHANDSGYADAFVTKLAASGGALVYSTYLGGMGGDEARALAIDPVGNAYVGGASDSFDFPVTIGAFQGPGVEDIQAFVAKIAPAGNALTWCTCLGGSGFDIVRGVAVDATGHAFVTGETATFDFPTTTGCFQSAHAGSRDVFATQFSPDATTLVYSTYLGGSGEDYGAAIVIDGSGQAYLAGQTGSADFPVSGGAYQTALKGASDGFVAALSSTGSTTLWSTFLGGSGDEGMGEEGLTFDPAGNLFVAGATSSVDFPITPGASQPTAVLGWNGFLTAMTTAGGAPYFGTYLGGYFDDRAEAVVSDGAGLLIACGQTSSSDFSVTSDGYQTSSGGGMDAFVTAIDLTRTTVTSPDPSGPGTLDDALRWANAQPGIQPLTIDFDMFLGSPMQRLTRTMPGQATTITVDGTSPILTRANVVLDGSTQSGYGGEPAMFITSGGAGYTLLRSSAAGTTIKAIGFYGTTGSGIHLLPGSNGSNVFGCSFGIDEAGAAAATNVGVKLDANDCRLGGTGANEWNRFGAATTAGVELLGSNNAVRGNLFGYAPDTSPTSLGIGVAIVGSQNTIGGTLAEGNTIGNCTTAAIVIDTAGQRNTVRGNSIHGNGAGIDLQGSANASLAAPVIDLVTDSSGSGAVDWHWSGSGTGPFTVEFFATAIGGTPQGDMLLGTASGSAFAGPQSTALSRPLDTPEELTATITDGQGNTSAFSAPMVLAMHLAIVQHPTDGPVHANLPATQAEIQDSDGTAIANAAADIQITVYDNPAGGVLTGTLVQRAAGGVATFGDLQLDKVGDGYTLQASHAPLTPAVSNMFNTTAGPSSPARSTATVPAGTAGVPTIIQVHAFDAYDNPRLVGGDTVTIAISGANSGTPPVTDEGDGTYTAEYTPSLAGTDQVAISLNGTAIANSPFASPVSPGPTDPSRCTASAPNGVAGSPTYILIQSRDSNGNARGSGGDSVTVEVSGANQQTASVTDRGDGSYQATYTPTLAGADTIDIMISGSSIQDTPLSSQVAPGPTDAAHTTATVPDGEVGQPTSITIQTRDAYDNLRSTGGDAVSVTVSGSNSGTASVTDRGDGTYAASYTPASPGADQVAIRIGGAPILGSPYTSQVAGQVTAPELSNATVPPQIGAGSVSVIDIQARDALGHPRTTGGDTVVVQVSGANTGTPPVTDLGNGRYQAQYTPVDLGADTVAISINGAAILDSPFTSQIVPGATSPVNTTATVPPGTAGQPTTIQIEARDDFGNPRAVGGDTVVVAVSGANTANGMVTDHGDGTYAATYTPSVAGLDAIAISINGPAIGGSPFASQVSPGWVDQARSSFTATPGEAVANGRDIILLELFLRDSYGNPLPGIPPDQVELHLPASGFEGEGLSITRPLLPSDAAGRMTIRVTATRPQAATIEAGCRGGVWRADVLFNRRPVDAARSEVTIDPALIAANGTEQATLSVTLRDPGGAPVEGVGPADRTLALTGDVAAQVQATDDGTVTGQDGRYTVSLSGTAAGDTTVQPRVDGGNLPTVVLQTRQFLDIALPAGISFMSLPLTPEPGSLADFLATPRMQVAWWNPITQSYAPWPWASRSEAPSLVPGTAVWLRCEGPVNYRLYGSYAAPAAQRVPLAIGWNTVGNPFQGTFTWDLSTIRVEVNGTDVGSLATEALWTTTIRPFGWSWLPTVQPGYTLIFDTSKPGFGQAQGNVPAGAACWVRSLRDGVTLVLAPPSGAARGRSAQPVGPRDWSARLTASLNGEQDTDNLFGASAQLTRALPFTTPPEPIATQPPAVELAFLDETTNERLAGLLRPGTNRSYSWQAEVTSRAAGEVTLAWPGLLRELPRGVLVELTDLTSGQTTLLNTHAAYRYAGRAGEQRQFTLAARYGNLDRSQITALQATPTRGAGVALSLTTTGPAEVTMTVRGLSGRLVKQFSQTVATGTSTLTWDGTDQTGRRVPQGTYQVEAVALSANGAASRAVRTVVVD